MTAKLQSLSLYRSWGKPDEITGSITVEFPSGETKVTLTATQAAPILLAAREAIINAAKERSAVLADEAALVLMANDPVPQITSAEIAAE